MTRYTVPGDKSLSHRALMLASLATGVSTLRGVLPSADVRSTAGVLAALGVSVPQAWSPDSVMRVAGLGRRGLLAPTRPLDCGNSGTTTRLMAGIVSGHPIEATFIGDASLSRRPMRRVAQPLTQMGATFRFEVGDGLPMTVRGADLRAIEWVSPTASAQVKSAILLAALVAGVGASVSEPARSRDHTERMLAALGADLTVDGTVVRLAPVSTLAPLDFTVPGDPSSAVFLLAAALLTDTSLVVENVGVNPTRTGALDVLRRMGASVSHVNERTAGGEPVADIVVAPGAGLRGTTIAGDAVPSLIDEIPMLACLAACADGETRITDAGELRVKESDRIATVVANLRAVGADADELPDGLVVRGSSGRLAGRVVTHGDHRIAMAFGVLGHRAGNSIEVDDPACVDVSYPGFWAQLHTVGGRA